MNDSLTLIVFGLIAIHIGFLYIFSAVFEWSWFYTGPQWSPYYLIGHENTLAAFKVFGGLCYACGFLFVAGSLIDRAMWMGLIGLVAHSAAMVWAGWTQAR